MFKLQRIEIVGFKSFADHVELQFTGDGITAVVGPNGCGKSNVADAIAWVLGEQRAKQLRGGEMKDVIFQGTRSRKPGGMAEVVLHLMRGDDVVTEDEESVDDIDLRLEELDEGQTTFDPTDAQAKMLTQGAAANGEAQATSEGQTDSTEAVASESDTAMARVARGRRHWRPAARTLDFAPGETVSVTRRLYRSGESEYLLNNRACRLRDIQDLFSGTGLAGAHYAIIEQGRIGQILSAKPMDRRALIEEAAGITKFRVRQRAAEARLEGARSNLNRVTDIVLEVERQVGSLRRQATKARRYTAMRDELRSLLRDVYRADFTSLTSALAGLRETLAAAATDEAQLESELAISETSVRESTAHARHIEEQLAGARAAAADAALQRDRREREYAYQQEQLAALEQRIANLKRDSEVISERLVALHADAESGRATEEELREAGESAAELLRAAEAAYAISMSGVAQSESEIERLRAEHLQHTAAAERLAEIGRQLEAALERLNYQAEGLAREGERARLAHETARTEAARLAEEMEAARNRLAALLIERESAAASVAEAREVAVAAVAEHTRIQSDFERVRHRLRALTELDARHAHYSEAVQRIFSDDKKDFTHSGTLADVLRVAPEWERAVESIFGDHLQAVIVPTPGDALRAAAWLHADGLGRATFLVAGLHGGSADQERLVEESDAVEVGKVKRGRKATKNRPDGFGSSDDSGADGARLSTLLGASPEIVAALERALPREMNARIAFDLDAAMTHSLADGGTYVTAAGESVTGGRLLGAGGAGVPGVAAGLLAFKREMRELEDHSIELESAAIFAEGQATDAARRVGELEDAVVLLNEAMGRAEREQVTCEMNHNSLLQDIERTERHLRVVASDARRLDEEIAELSVRRQTAEREAGVAAEMRRSVGEKVTAAAESLTERRRAAGLENERLGEQRAAAATATERRRAAAQELRRTESEIADLERRLARHETEQEESHLRHEELRQSIEGIESQSSRTGTDETEQRETIARLGAELQQARERADAQAVEYSERTRGLAAARDRRHHFEVQQAEREARLSYLHEACLSELGQPLEELAAENFADQETARENFADDESESNQTEEASVSPGRVTRGEFNLEAARVRVEELRARLESFGGVNTMALEELVEAEERFTFLTTQRKDITDGIHSTEEALREIKRRSRDRFRSAFEAINSNFSQLFGELFGGGRGEMSLIDTEDVLESGIDIIAQPPGKRLQSVLLLSGGEKAMAALALLLAVFRYRPSPFCLLDEVDAPLDEANIGRFTRKIVEMSERTQFIVITHNKRTMEVARALYGVTMEEAGISKLVSAKFE
jgi:chromosome segregation protein